MIKEHYDSLLIKSSKVNTMKKLLIAPLFLLSLISSAAVYYIDPAGKNTNNGSSGSPWNTLSYACSKVTARGDVIHVNAGTYTETAQCILSAGVSIEGAGVTSVIRSQVGNKTFTILLSSGAQATNGGQHISDLKLDGSSLTAYGAIKVAFRSNVEVYNCTIVDFSNFGVSFIDGEPPTTYATGNKFYNNNVINCSTYAGGNTGCLEIQGQDGMLIYGNTLTATRGTANTGDCIYAVEGFLKNVKIYNNTMTKTYIPGTSNWDFAIEIWNSLGGNEIYNNKIIGSVDIVMCKKGSSSYSTWIHDNTIGQTSLKASQATRGVLLEFETADVIIEKNMIHDVASGVYFQQGARACAVSNVRISYNQLMNIGAATASTGWGVHCSFEPDSRDDTYSNIQIWNNSITAQTSGYSTICGIWIPDGGSSSNISIQNNIIKDFDDSPILAYGTGGTSINTLSIQNNLMFGNGNSNNPRYVSITPTNSTVSNNIKSDPLFVSISDLHLATGSPAIGKGLKIAGLASDIEGKTINDPPSIGAFESGSKAAVAAVLPVYQSSVIENAAPSVIGMTYDLSLATTVPASGSFVVQVNSAPRAVTEVSISGNKVMLTLASPVIKGDVVTVAYTKPASNPLQTSLGGQAATLTAQAITNNVLAVIPVATTTSIKMTVAPNPVHRVVNILLAYTGLSAATVSANPSNIIRILDVSGRLFIERFFTYGIGNVRIPVNLRSGIYIVQMLTNGTIAGTQNIIVY